MTLLEFAHRPWSGGSATKPCVTARSCALRPLMEDAAPSCASPLWCETPLTTFEAALRENPPATRLPASVLRTSAGSSVNAAGAPLAVLPSTRFVGPAVTVEWPTSLALPRCCACIELDPLEAAVGAAVTMPTRTAETPNSNKMRLRKSTHLH